MTSQRVETAKNDIEPPHTTEAARWTLAKEVPAVMSAKTVRSGELTSVVAETLRHAGLILSRGELCDQVQHELERAAVAGRIAWQAVDYALRKIDESAALDDEVELIAWSRYSISRALGLEKTLGAWRAETRRELTGHAATGAVVA